VARANYCLNGVTVVARILVIEDSPTNMKLVRLLLEGSGHEVLGAEDAPTGIALAQRENPDLILIDIQLPGMDGLTATGLLRGDPATQKLKIVALTALAMKGDEERILAAGCDAYIAKPIHSTSFLARVHGLLEGEGPQGA
jgi:two-component system cell cycle response regulator DivK